MSNIKSYFEMRPWVPEATNTKEENNLLVAGVLEDLKGLEPGANSVLIGGDTLVFAAIDANGDRSVYECTIRRASANLVESGEMQAFHYPTDGSVN